MIMNYEKLYYAIINKALRKQISGQRFKGNGTYYEFHHIVPKSLGGTENENNLVLLTSKEHYLCHWLLVKRFALGSNERMKMIKAWYMMAAVGDTKRPKRNMNGYAKYRNEMSKTMSVAQSGKRNSQFGKHWYTSIDTGESLSLFEKPNERYIEGRNWFNKAKYEIYDIKTHERIYDENKRLKTKRNENLKDKYRLIWNEFLSSNLPSIIQFNKKYYPKCNLNRFFRIYIDEYKEHKKNLTRFIK